MPVLRAWCNRLSKDNNMPEVLCNPINPPPTQNVFTLSKPNAALNQACGECTLWRILAKFCGSSSECVLEALWFQLVLMMQQLWNTHQTKGGRKYRNKKVLAQSMILPCKAFSKPYLWSLKWVRNGEIGGRAYCEWRRKEGRNEKERGRRN